MKTKQSKADLLEQEMKELLENGTMDKDPTGTLMRLAMQAVLQRAMESERTEFLNRGYYTHRDSASVLGRRSGYKPGHLRTAEGAVQVFKPQVRDVEEPFQPRVLEHFAQDTLSLLRLVIEGYARGLSTRDVEAAFRDDRGGALLSRTEVSRITEVLWKQYEAFCRRDLSGFDLVYLSVDAVYESLRERMGLKEGILCAWGIVRNGKKVLLHVALGNKESASCCLDFIRHMVKRGLKVPVAVTTDGAPGLIKAVRASFPRSLPVRCWVHGMRNVLDKVPEDAQAEVKAYLSAVRDAPTFEKGEALARDFIQDYRRAFPSAVACFEDDLTARLNHLKLPPAHRRKVYSTNLLERGFEEYRRRGKVIPRFFTEKSCLKLVFASLWRASQSWRGLRMRSRDLEALDRLAMRLGIRPHDSKSFRRAVGLHQLAER